LELGAEHGPVSNMAPGGDHPFLVTDKAVLTTGAQRSVVWPPALMAVAVGVDARGASRCPSATCPSLWDSQLCALRPVRLWCTGLVRESSPASAAISAEGLNTRVGATARWAAPFRLPPLPTAVRNTMRLLRWPVLASVGPISGGCPPYHGMTMKDRLTRAL